MVDRSILHLYPPSYRGEYGDEMLEVLSEVEAEIRKRSALERAGCAAREAGGLLRGALEEHWRAFTGPRGSGVAVDLGCGPGNTANELAGEAYGTYVGVDISEAALEKGRRRSEKNGRGSKNSFVQGDFIGYEPSGQFTSSRALL